MIVWCGNLTILLSGLTFHCFWYRKQKTLCDSLHRPSRSDFVQLEFVEVAKMKLKNPMLVVTDIDKSVEFYKKVFGLHVIMDFGANKTLTGGLALQTVETYKDFIGKSDISFGGNNFEIYFEEDNFDEFADKLKKCDVEYVHPIVEHSWGQRVVRFYDPDKHIIEVGENMKIVCKRFLNSGMTPEQVAERMDVPMKFVNACMR